VSGKRVLTIKFNADVSDRMPWKFQPQQVYTACVPPSCERGKTDYQMHDGWAA